MSAWVPLAGFVGVYTIGSALGLELWLKIFMCFIVYVALRTLFRDAGESPMVKGKRLAAAAKSPASPATDRTFGNVPLSQESPSGSGTPEEEQLHKERLRKRVTRARELGNIPLSQQSASNQS